MTELLTKAFEKASSLPRDDQEFLAYRLLLVLDAKHIWQATSYRSPEFLSKLADDLMLHTEDKRSD